MSIEHLDKLQSQLRPPICKRDAARQPLGNMAVKRAVTLKLDQRLSTTTSKRALETSAA